MGREGGDPVKVTWHGCPEVTWENRGSPEEKHGPGRVCVCSGPAGCVQHPGGRRNLEKGCVETNHKETRNIHAGYMREPGETRL